MDAVLSGRFPWVCSETMSGFLSSIFRTDGERTGRPGKAQGGVPASVWRVPLVREITVILLIKLILLFSIKTVWFSAPTVPADGEAQVAEHLLGSRPIPPTLPALEETPR
jgi:hypothetical protein